MKSLLSAATALGAVALTLAPIAAHAGTLNWSGDVDDTAVIRISHDRVWIDSNMKGVHNVRSTVDGRLSDRWDHVNLGRVRGRGDVQVIEQPNRRNHFTAAVRINDPQAGASHYHFTLNW